MSLAPGTRFGPYEILAPLGAGGMGEVWKARDTRLDRIVALKFSASEFTERFEREARAISALNHPHICQLYDVGTNFLVIEFIDGTPLAGPLPIERALTYAAQILDALHAAHTHGIVHRDLKPGNILVTKSGVKLLDFGVAKQLAITEVDVAETKPATVNGQILGTLEYMSPEQLQGRPVDARSDIFSFGCVLYEMLTGRRAFGGGSAASVIGAILEREPEPLDAAAPLARVVRTCLAKDPEQRFQSALDLKRALEWASEPSAAQAAAPARIPPLAALTALSVALATALGWSLLRTEPAPIDRYTVTRLTHDKGLTTDPAMTTDGKLIAFASDRGGEEHLDIYVQQAAGGQVLRITSEPGDDHEPTFSPDGTTIVFRSERAGGGLYTVPALGGDARLLVPGGHDPRVSPDGRYVAYTTSKSGADPNISSGQCYVIPLGGGEPRLVTPGYRGATFPTWISRQTLLFSGLLPKDPTGSKWWVVDIENPRAREAPIIPRLVRSAAANLASNELLLVSNMAGDAGSLWTVGINPLTAQVRGTPRRLTLGIAGDLKVAAAGDGSLVVATAQTAINVWSLARDGSGGVPRQVTFDPSDKAGPEISSDGRYLAYMSTRNGNPDVFVRDLTTGKEITAASTPQPEDFPSFSAAGSRLAYASYPHDLVSRLFVMPTLGGRPQQVAEGVGRFDQLSDDGRYVVWHGGGDQVGVVLDLETNTRATVLRAEPKSIYQIRISRDGRWVVFLTKSDESDSRIYAAPFRGAQLIPPSEWIPLTRGEGEDKPRLTTDRRRLYFTSPQDGFRCIWQQDVDPDALQPRGSPVVVHHSHSARRSLRNVSLNMQEISVGGDQLIFNMAETTANLWRIQPQQP